MQNKECEDNLELTRALYRGELAQQQQRFADRQVIDGELFGLYKSQTDADFNLYKSQRDGFDAINQRITDIEKREIATATALPYQFALVDCKIDKASLASYNNLMHRTARMIQGEVVLPLTPTVTGVPSLACCCSGTPTPPVPAV